LLNVGGAGPLTVTLAEAVPPFPVSFEVTALVTLFFAPVPIALTDTEKVHDALAARLAADRLTLPEPAAAVIVPPQLFVKPLGVDTTSPVGNESVNPTPVRVVPVFGFERLKVKLVVPFNGIEVAPNALLMVGGVGPLEPPPLLPPHPLRLSSVPPMANTTIANTKTRSLIIAVCHLGGVGLRYFVRYLG